MIGLFLSCFDCIESEICRSFAVESIVAVLLTLEALNKLTTRNRRRVMATWQQSNRSTRGEAETKSENCGE